MNQYFIMKYIGTKEMTDYQDDYYEVVCNKCKKSLGMVSDYSEFPVMICTDCHSILSPVNPYTKARREEEEAGIIHPFPSCFLKKIPIEKLIFRSTEN